MDYELINIHAKLVGTSSVLQNFNPLKSHLLAICAVLSICQKTASLEVIQVDSGVWQIQRYSLCIEKSSEKLSLKVHFHR